MKSWLTTILFGGLAWAACASAADAQLVTRPRQVFPSNFSSSFPSRHYGAFSGPSNDGYYGAGTLHNPWAGGLGMAGYSGTQDFASPSYGLGGYPMNFARSSSHSGLLPMAPGGAVFAPEGAPTLTPGETVRAGSSWSRGR